MAQTGLQLFEHELKNMYAAEQKLVGALSTMSDVAEDEGLSTMLARHGNATKGHVQRLEQIFDHLRIGAEQGSCAAVDGMLEDFDNFVSKETSTDNVLNMFVVDAGIQIEYFEIVCYKALVRYANNVGSNRAATLLHDTLIEERKAADDLERLAHQFGQKVTGWVKD